MKGHEIKTHVLNPQGLILALCLVASCGTPKNSNVGADDKDALSSTDYHSTSNAGISLLDAVEQGNIQPVQRLIDEDPQVLKQTNQFGQTALHLSSQRGNVKLIHFFSQYINVNAQCSKGTTPLMLAAACNQEKAVRYLIKIGADVEAKDKKGQQAWSYALEHEKILFFLLEKTKNISHRRQSKHAKSPCQEALAATMLIQELDDSSKRVAKVFVQKVGNFKIPICRQNSCGWFTLMHLAAEDNRLNILRALLDLRFSPNIVDSYQRKPLQLAKPQAAKLLLQAATAKALPKFTQALLEAGAKVGETSKT